MKIYFYICIYAYIYHKPKDKCSPLRSNRRMVKQSLLLIVDCAVGIFFSIYFCIHINLGSCFVLLFRHNSIFCYGNAVSVDMCEITSMKTDFRIAKKNVHDSNSLAVLFVNIFVSSTLFRLSLQLCWMLGIFLII